MISNTLLSKVARLYYIENRNQQDIAKRLNMSMAGVSRALTRARDCGIVEIRVHDRTENDLASEALLESEYRLRESAVVVASESDDSKSVAMARALADILTRRLRDGSVLGVSWGETLRAMADYLPTVNAVKADVVPIIGAMGTIETGVYPNAIATGFARKLNGKAYLVNAPAIVSSREICESMKQDRIFRPVALNWDSVDTAVVSVSGVTPSDSISRLQIFSVDELEQLRAQGVAGATNFDFLDSDGFQIQTEIDQRILKIGFERLRNIQNLVVVAFGAHKVIPLRAVLRSGIVDVLITDQVTAQALLAPSHRRNAEAEFPETTNQSSGA